MAKYSVRPPSSRRLVRDLPAGEQPLIRARHYGEEVLSAAELLALVLGTADGLDLAQDILRDFGSVEQLAKAPVAELARVRGVGEALARRIKAALQLGVRALQVAGEERPVVDSPASAALLLMPEMMHLEQEQARVILLNTRNRVIEVRTIFIGSTTSIHIRLADLLRPAVQVNATAFIFAHNHPSGDPHPSPEDISTSRKLNEAAKLLDLSLLDSLIIGRNRYYSLKEAGYLP